MRLPRPLFGNCLLAALYYVWRGRIHKIWLLRGSKSRGVHIVCETTRGHLLDFRTTRRRDRWAPLWFEGKLRGCSRHYAAAARKGRVLMRIW